MTNKISVDSPGSIVRMGDIDVKVIAVSIRGCDLSGFIVQYEIAWIIAGDRKTAWVEEHETETKEDPESLEVGFK